MSQFSSQKESDRKPALVRRWDGSHDPFRAVKALMGWDPFREMVPFERTEGDFLPTFEVKETKEQFVFKADVPGVNESDLNITLNGNRLTISGKREAEKQTQHDTYYAYERSFGSFTRAFALPDGIDSNTVKAELTNGVLTVQVNKVVEAQPKKITVQTVSKT